VSFLLGLGRKRTSRCTPARRRDRG